MKITENIEIRLSENKVLYKGHEVENEYGEEISLGFNVKSTGDYLKQCFDLPEEKAIDVAFRVRLLMAEHRLGEDEAINQVLTDDGYFDTL